ncbi:MAG TPA: glycosyltransferase [Bryobacteraceae bacterium]|jgi:glycosyltransferase involved in cell wall biosynthesis|nr:glycosyltransferase [Bryobacteraceae bacterium]
MLRILFVVPQMPQDPSSGAARSLTTICEMLAESGFVVRALGTTGTENAAHMEPLAYLRGLGCDVHVAAGRTGNRIRPELEFTRRGIGYRLLDIGRKTMAHWEHTCGRQFDLAFDDELHRFQPDILFTFGGSTGDVQRQHRARRQGTKIVFGLRNEGYFKQGFFDHVDAVLTPSRYLSSRYREAIGVESTPLPTPIELDDVLAEERDPIFATMINPAIEKGLMFFARLAEELSIRRPDIPVLVIESRGTAGRLATAGLAGGFDLQRHENLMFSPAVPKPKDIFVPAKTLLAPSLIEASGRVVVEALLNGVPPLVSDRGGLAEAANGGGFVLPLPQDLDVRCTRPVEASAVEPWIEAIVRLEDNVDFYARESQRAREASRAYLREELAPRYAEFFRKVAGG